MKARLEILKVHAKKVKMDEGRYTSFIFGESKEMGMCIIHALKLGAAGSTNCS